RAGSATSGLGGRSRDAGAAGTTPPPARGGAEPAPAAGERVAVREDRRTAAAPVRGRPGVVDGAGAGRSAGARRDGARVRDRGARAGRAGGGPAGILAGRRVRD